MLVVPRVCVSREGGRAFLGARSKLDGGERSKTRRHYAKEMVSSVILESLDGQRWSHSGHVAEELFLRDRVRQSLTDVPLYRKKYLAGQLSVTASSLLEHASFRLSREPDWYPVFFYRKRSARRDYRDFSRSSFVIIRNLFLGGLETEN